MYLHLCFDEHNFPFQKSETTLEPEPQSLSNTKLLTYGLFLYPWQCSLALVTRTQHPCCSKHVNKAIATCLSSGISIAGHNVIVPSVQTVTTSLCVTSPYASHIDSIISTRVNTTYLNLLSPTPIHSPISLNIHSASSSSHPSSPN